ncbi:MAG: phage holin family protein [Geodermatophilaceae bacterium]|nr:phage holin family protein [Geodermatophilaceae bacterium]
MATTSPAYAPIAPPPVPLSKTAEWTPDPGAAQPSLGELVTEASTHLSTMVRGEIELAKTEVTGSLKKGAMGAAFFGAAAVVFIFSLVFLLISFAEGMVQLGLYRWLSYLIVWLLLVLIAGIAGLLGLRAVKKVRKPERTIETLKDSKQLLQRGSTP